MIDNSCALGIEPRYVVGPCLAEDGITTEQNCTAGDIIKKLWDIRKAHPNIHDRNNAYATLLRLWAAKVVAEWTDLLDNTWLRPQTHDELRRLLTIKETAKYYTITLLGSAALSAAVALIQAGIALGSQNIEIAWEPTLNATVGYTILLF